MAVQTSVDVESGNYWTTDGSKILGNNKVSRTTIVFIAEPSHLLSRAASRSLCN